MSMLNFRVWLVFCCGIALSGCDSPNDAPKATSDQRAESQSPPVPEPSSVQSQNIESTLSTESQKDPLAPRYESSLADGIDFRRPGYPLWIKAVQGMSVYEPTHRWTDASLSKTAKITLTSDLPARFTLEINTAFAFGPNAEQETIVRVGKDQRRIRVLLTPGVFRLPFKGIKGIDTIEIIPPAPISPAELEHNPAGDPRRLGVALVNIKVLPLDESQSKPAPANSKKKH